MQTLETDRLLLRGWLPDDLDEEGRTVKPAVLPLFNILILPVNALTMHQGKPDNPAAV